MSTVDAPDTVWISARQARERSGLTAPHLTALALAGRIRTRALPGVAVRFHAGDCDRVRADLAGEPAEAPAAASA